MTGWSSFDEDVRVAVMRGFVEEARPPAPNELAVEVGRGRADVEASLQRLADAHVLVLAPGTSLVWMANPFSGLPTPYEVRSGDRRWWGNCIWDALGILATIGVDGVVRTQCADCGEALHVAVVDGEADGEGIVHFGVPAASWWDDIGFN